MKRPQRSQIRLPKATGSCSSSARTTQTLERQHSIQSGRGTYFSSSQSIHAGDGRISGHRAESLYSGSGILWVRNYFLRERDFQVGSRNCHFSPTINPLKQGKCGETLSL